MPLVSVIIPTHNQAQFLGEAIRSALAQTVADLEVVVIDDGSTDATEAVVASVSDPRLRYERQSRRERSAARNRGIQMARGSYLAFLDADDLFRPTKLEIQLRAFESNPGVGVVYSDVVFCDAAGRASDRPGCPRPEPPPSGWVLDDLVVENFLTIHATLVRSDCLASAGSFDEELHAFEDWDLWLRIAAEREFAYAPGVVGLYRSHSAMTSRDRRHIWRGALAARHKLHSRPEFERLRAGTRQTSTYQLGILECLVGERRIGRGLLRTTFVRKPRIRNAGVVLALSYLGRPLLRWATELRAGRAG